MYQNTLAICKTIEYENILCIILETIPANIITYSFKSFNNFANNASMCSPNASILTSYIY